MKLNAIELLIHDHHSVRKKLIKLTETSGREKAKQRRLMHDIQTQLTIHRVIEEDIFYPAFKTNGGDEITYFEAKRQHRTVEDFVLPDLLESQGHDAIFARISRQLRRLVEQHADEEEKVMFRQAREKLSKQELHALGSAMQARKKKLEKQYAQNAESSHRR